MPVGFGLRHRIRSLVFSRQSAAIIVITFFLIAGSWILRSDVFVVRTIDFVLEANLELPESELRIALEKIYGSSIISVGTKSIKDELIQKYPAVSDVKIEKRLPSTLLVSFNLEKAMLFVKCSAKYYLLSQNQTVLKVSELAVAQGVAQVNLLGISDEECNFKVNDHFGWVDLSAISPITRFNWASYGLSIEKLEIDQEKITLELLVSGKYAFKQLSILFRSSEKVDVITEKLKTLELLLSSSEIISRNLSQIDLRFERPVVRDL